MSSKSMKLLMENFGNFLKERAPINKAVASQVARVVQEPYVNFVQDMTQLASDPRVKAILDAGLIDGIPNDEKLTKKEIAPSVQALRPTQNEIALDKSLGGKFGPLQNLPTLELFLKGGDVLVPSKDGGKVATAMNGTIIIDGHHRWSSLYCINTEANVQSVDLTLKGLQPMDYLKIVQMTIASATQNLPTATAKGSTNLLTIDENTLKQYVLKEISDGAVAIFAKYGKGRTKEEIANFIWVNVQSMMKTGQPVPGAPKRDVMPQTDNIRNWPDLAASGKINFKDTAQTAADAGSAFGLRGVANEALERRISQLIAEELKKTKR